MIPQYTLMLDRAGDSHPYLVKEASVDYPSECLNCPGQIADMLHKCFRLDEKAEEYVYLVVFDSAGHVNSVFELSHGTVRESLIGARELLLRVLLSGGVSYCVAHSHPSGEVQPSSEDKSACRRLKEASDILSIPMVDFLIIGNGCYLSFARENLL